MWVLLLFAGLLLIPTLVFAQSGVEASLSQPDIQSFPEITTYLSLYDAEGVFIRGLDNEDVVVLENNQPVPLNEFTYFEPGVQFVLALNPGPAFAIRDSQGTSRYDLIAGAVQEWIEAVPSSTPDDLSLLTTSGPRLNHAPANEIQQAFADYQPDARNAAPSFDLLGQAINTAADPSPLAGMSRAVLFITTPPERDMLPALQNILELARQQGVRVSAWLVTSTANFGSPDITLFSELLAETGGSTFLFSGIESLPPLSNYLDPVRGLYLVQYQSQATASGEYQVTAEIQVEDEIVVTAAQSYTLEILPPNPVFVAPPAAIERREPENENANAALIPTSQNLEIIIEFPDGKPRQTIRSVLLVDGQIVQQNDQAPFDTFRWDISSYLENSEHLLKVVVEDSLGLVGESIETPITIQIAGQPTGLAAVLVEQAPRIAVLAAVAAGAVLLWVLVVGGRLRPADATQPRSQRRGKDDPVTQPVPIRSEQRPRRESANPFARLAERLPWQSRRSDEPLAYLELLGPGGNGGRGVTQAITEEELTFGRAVSRASNLLEDPSASDLHARLVRRPDGSFWLYDADSTAGTWVNYEPVTTEGRRLRHGDLVHMGRVGFRFRLADESHARHITISPEKDNP